MEDLWANLKCSGDEISLRNLQFHPHPKWKHEGVNSFWHPHIQLERLTFSCYIHTFHTIQPQSGASSDPDNSTEDTGDKRVLFTSIFLLGYTKSIHMNFDPYFLEWNPIHEPQISFKPLNKIWRTWGSWHPHINSKRLKFDWYVHFR